MLRGDYQGASQRITHLINRHKLVNDWQIDGGQEGKKEIHEERTYDRSMIDPGRSMVGDSARRTYPLDNRVLRLIK